MPAKRKIDWWIYSIPLLVVLTVLLHIFLYTRLGKIGLGLYYLGPLLIAFLAVVFLVIALVYSLVKRPFITKWRMIGFAGLLLFPVLYMLRIEQSGTFFSAYPSSHHNNPSKVAFRIPFDSTITVGWGGDKAEHNYHVSSPDQRWAYDLLITKNGKSYSGDSTKLESYYCYGLPVLAPCDGKVVKAMDGERDMPIGDLSNETNISGNHIVVEVAKNEYLVLCHLKPGSLLVKKEDIVKEGQEIAAVGNSGHTSEPHLHIHLQDEEKDDFAEGIPMFFHHYFSDGKFVERGMPNGGFDNMGNFIGALVRNMLR